MKQLVNVKSTNVGCYVSATCCSIFLYAEIINNAIKCNKKNCVYWTERLKEHLQLPKNIDNITLKHNVKKET